MYPRWLFPGEREAMDPTCEIPASSALDVRHVLAWYNPVAWFWNAWRWPVDIIHVQWWSLPLLPVCLVFAVMARWRRIPLVVTAHNVLPHERSPWFLRASRLLYGQASHIIVHSETNLEQLLHTFDLDPDRVSHVAMGIDQAEGSLTRGHGATRVRNGQHDRPTLLFFGIIRPYKGLDVLLHALATVRVSHPTVRLIVAGKPWGRWEPYGEIITSLGLEGHVDVDLRYIPECEVAGYFGRADLAVLPYTHFDAQSAVGVQALGFGTPLLVTDTGGLPELVRNDRRWCVTPRDPVALAEAITRFFDDPDGATAEFTATLDETLCSMSWEKSAAAHLAIYRRVRG